MYARLSFYLYFFVINFTYSQENVSPLITSQGNEIYCPQTEQNIVTSFNIQDPDDIELDALYVQISQGYVVGEDILSLTGNHPGITTTWNVSEGKLEIAGNGGPALITDIIAAVYDIVFFSPNPNPEIGRAHV